MPRVLDLFCGAGGASMGYAKAGYEVVGMDIKHGKRYPFEYIRRDVMTLRPEDLEGFDLIHASPPCQTYSVTKHLRVAQGKSTSKQDLLAQVRSLLVVSEIPYVIENVKGAPLIDPIQLCGSAFGLKVRRHRLFESSMELRGTDCHHKEQGKPVGIYGSMRDEIPGGGHTAKTMPEAHEAMGINWMIWGELVEAIPPAYTHYIGQQIMSTYAK
jgi:DNA (cytosine-5)-methyltransferase 1